MWGYLLLVLFFSGALFLLRWLFKPVLLSRSDLPAISYKHTVMGSDVPFPSLYGPSEKRLSIIAPAFNEAERLAPFMSDTLSYLEKRTKLDPTFTWELIIVDDGSKDRTAAVAYELWGKKYGGDLIRVMKLAKNMGKGGAVQQGMLHARGELLLMADSDGATPMDQLEKLEAALQKVETKGAGIAVGSRAHLQEAAAATRKWYRNILGYGFNFLVSTLCVKGVKDTQCGFKLFTRNTAQHLFYNQHLRRWSFDVQLLYIAQYLQHPIVEIGVKWDEIPGSHLDIIDASLQMGRDLLVIRLCYLLRIWAVEDPFTSGNSHITGSLDVSTTSF